MNKSKRKYKTKKNLTEETDVPMTVAQNMKINGERCNSPPMSYDTRGHSTPIRTKNFTNDIEDSPELPYRCSPILMPCTQESNEIGWDWHSSSNKTSEKPKNICDQKNFDTPKRNRQLQKKRNSNSPLLYKPHKRKQVKLENMENIGKFAAELQALTEKMKTMKKKTDHVIKEENDMDNNIKPETVKFNDEDVSALEVPCNEIQTSDNTSDIKKKSSDYEDLFDDDIDDSMVKCSQEIEARLHLAPKNEPGTINLSVVNEEVPGNFRTSLSISHSSTENSKTSITSEISPGFPVMHTNNVSKTYSKNSSKKNSYSSTNTSISKDDSSKRSSFNNNGINSYNEKSHDKKSSSKECSKDLFEIPDDSFDDCLALCIDDKSMISKSKEYDNIFPDAQENKNSSAKPYKTTNHSSGKKANSFIPKSSVLAQKSKINNQQILNGKGESHDSNKYNSTMNNSKEEYTKAGMENRKFFKTKSLSDQYFGQGRINTNMPSNSSISSKGSVKSKSNLISSSVSTKSSTTQSITYPGNSSTSKTTSEYAYTLNVNRFAAKEGGSNIIRYNSLNNLPTHVKETAKDSQPIQCTREEIERKRMEAKMRLEAKRKLQMNTIVTNASAKVLPKRPIKR